MTKLLIAVKIMYSVNLTSLALNHKTIHKMAAVVICMQQLKQPTEDYCWLTGKIIFVINSHIPFVFVMSSNPQHVIRPTATLVTSYIGT